MKFRIYDGNYALTDEGSSLADGFKVAFLFKAAFTDVGYEIPSQDEMEAEADIIDKDIQKGNVFLAIQYVNNSEPKRMVGALVLLPKEDFAYIACVATMSSIRGKGIGTSLIKKAIRSSKKKGFSRIRLNVDTRNISARRFYEHLGFKKLRKKYYDGNNQSIKMELVF